MFSQVIKLSREIYNDKYNSGSVAILMDYFSFEEFF